MPLKQRYKKRIFWSCISFIGVLGIAYIVVPPAINLNWLKPNIEHAIYEQTGISATINGRVNFSLLGAATIVASNTDTMYGNISSLAISIPLHYIFNLKNAPLNSDIDIYNAKFKIDTIAPINSKHDINLYNSDIEFLGKEYRIIRGTISNNNFDGTVRTGQHKYDIAVNNGEFSVKNNNNNLNIHGWLYPDGTARGNLSIETDDINGWFEFGEPLIDKHISASMNFDWDGKYGFVFSDIHTNDLSGDISLSPDGFRTIKLRASDLNYDLSFITQPNSLFYQTHFDVDFYGDMLLNKRHFKHILIDASGDDKEIQVNKIVADNISLSDGIIDKNGAHNINLKITKNNITTNCLFSGTPNDWECSKFSYANITGTVKVKDKHFDATVSGAIKMPDINTWRAAFEPLGQTGTIDFSFSDMAGVMTITQKNISIKYRFAQNTTLNYVGVKIPFITQAMHSTLGSFTSVNNTITFIPHDQKWTLSITDNKFNLTGTNIKQLVPNQDLYFLKDAAYIISGVFSNKNLDNLNLLILDHVFIGSANKNQITLFTDTLNVDAFLDPSFTDNFEDLSFLKQHPIASLFDIPTQISLSAKAITYDKKTYNNFIYALHDDTQTMSITDNNRGNILATITKDKSIYGISLQLNRFVSDGTLLSTDSPLNIANTTITGDAKFITYGQIANDILYNMSGEFDLTFEGGDLMGFGTDNFYASANNIGTLTAEYAIANALNGGTSALKKMRFIGDYKNGALKTATPTIISLRHTDITGTFEIIKNKVNAFFKILLRGTSPAPTAISLNINPDNSRSYSLSEIMTNFDPEYMRTFVQTHYQF